MPSLFVIGNGFDLHLGLHTKYEDFRRFVEMDDPELASFLYNQNFSWADFEESLGDADYYKISEDAYNSQSEYIQELNVDWILENGIEERLEAYSTNIPAAFSKWISEISTNSIKPNCKQFAFNPSDRFLSFNYTDTLQAQYGIDPKHVLHIHGKANCPSKPIVVGHSGRYFSTKAQHKDDLAEESEYADTVMQEYLHVTEKPTKTIIEQNQSWFCNVSTFNDVYVLGHSMSHVDIVYFRELHENNQNLRWHFSYHNNEDRRNIDQSIKLAGLKQAQIKTIAIISEFQI